MVDEWARSFSQDKFGQSTTHWNKLVDRFKRGVGAPCPVVALGIPIGVVQEGILDHEPRRQAQRGRPITRKKEARPCYDREA